MLISLIIYLLSILLSNNFQLFNSFFLRKYDKQPRSHYLPDFHRISKFSKFANVVRLKLDIPLQKWDHFSLMYLIFLAPFRIISYAFAAPDDSFYEIIVNFVAKISQPNNTFRTPHQLLLKPLFDSTSPFILVLMYICIPENTSLLRYKGYANFRMGMGAKRIRLLYYGASWKRLIL